MATTFVDVTYRGLKLAEKAKLLEGEEDGGAFLESETPLPVGTSLAATLGFFVACLAAVAWIFRTGYRLKS